MKKVLLFITLLATITACSTEHTGRENACQYVREQMPLQAENIKKVEVIDEESVLTTLLLSFGISEIYIEKSKYISNEITNDKWFAFRDSMMTVGFDVRKAWIMDKITNDSLRLLPKYRGSWRKAYTVEVTMKSGANEQYRVCMDKDGVTPVATNDEIIKKSKEFFDAF